MTKFVAAFMSGEPQAINLVLLGVFFILGLGLVIFSLLAFWLPVRQRAIDTFRRRWGATEAVSDETLRQALRVLYVPRAWARLVGAIGMVVGVVLWALLPAVSGGPSAIGTYSVTIAFELAWFAWIAVCVGVGRLIGVALLRARSRGLPRYADPRPRRLRLFLPRWFTLVLGAWIVLLSLVTLVALPFLRYPYFGSGVDAMTSLPLGHAAALLVPALLVGASLVGMFAMRLFLTLPHLGGPLAAPEARLVDFSFREESIYALVNGVLYLVAMLSVNQWLFLAFNLPLSDNRVFASVMPLACIVLFLPAVGVTGVFLSSYHKEAPARFYQHESDTLGGHVA